MTHSQVRSDFKARTLGSLHQACQTALRLARESVALTTSTIKRGEKVRQTQLALPAARIQLTGALAWETSHF